MPFETAFLNRPHQIYRATELQSYRGLANYIVANFTVYILVFYTYFLITKIEKYE